MWRHGCRHRASMDGFTACPARGEGTAHSTDSALTRTSSCIPKLRPAKNCAHCQTNARYVLLAAPIAGTHASQSDERSN
ncbi:hypothetical protein BJD12_08765 [Xanthomonas vesicatoria ATCC 35937]|nr:hypothetical protein BJD12_08765 [Xanthomonas vesicatoria ATCC 35937]